MSVREERYRGKGGWRRGVKGGGVVPRSRAVKRSAGPRRCAIPGGFPTAGRWAGEAESEGAESLAGSPPPPSPAVPALT